MFDLEQHLVEPVRAKHSAVRLYIIYELEVNGTLNP